MELEEGDRFYIFSDGYPDQFGGDPKKPGGKKFKSSNFKKLLVSIQSMDMHSQKKELDRFIEEWKGELEQLDDICVIGVEL